MSNSELVTQLEKAFADRFDEPPKHLICSPGRVNLIGEHTDYNDGFVMPMAIEFGIWFAVRPRSDRRVHVYSLEFDEPCEFDLDDMSKEEQYWGEYVKAVTWALQEKGYNLKGWEGVIVGNIPKGAGLSSSAALEVGVTQVFAEISSFDISPAEKALRSQYAENEWVGVQCGIMDQMIVAAGTDNHALLIDCRDLSTRQVPIPSNAAVVILDTSTRRGLVDSAYNERREQCQSAAKFYHREMLRDVDEEMMHAGDRPEELTYKRAHHVVTENARALQAAEVMKQQDAEKLGALMYASHVSLRDDFEVSSKELNEIVEIALSFDGCFGARMTGAGFGGCAVALVQKHQSKAFCDFVASEYQQKTGLKPNIYSTGAAQGAHTVY